MTLSILICSLESRDVLLLDLMRDLLDQMLCCDATDYVEIIPKIDSGELTIGAKRQELLKEAIGDYVVFIDDDDFVKPYYTYSILKALEQKPDCVGIRGYKTTDGIKTHDFYISKDHYYNEKGNVYEWHTNHLSPVRREIALQAGFPDRSYGEDEEYGRRLRELGLLKKEIIIEKPIYHYRYSTQHKTHP